MLYAYDPAPRNVWFGGLAYKDHGNNRCVSQVCTGLMKYQGDLEQEISGDGSFGEFLCAA